MAAPDGHDAELRQGHRANGVAWRIIDSIPVTSPEQTILDCASTINNDKAYRRIVRQAQVDDLTSHARVQGARRRAEPDPMGLRMPSRPAWKPSATPCCA
jgi:hypothetical protein